MLHFPTQLFHAASSFFLIESSVFAGEGGLGFSSDAGFDLCPSDEVGESVEGVLPVLFLGPILSCIDEQFTVGIDLVGGDLD